MNLNVVCLLLAFSSVICQECITEEEEEKDLVVTEQVYLTIEIDGKEAGKIVIGLFGEIVPKTVRNFVELATHKHGFGYRGSSFHRVDKYYYIHGGGFEHNGTTEGTSIYGKSFPDENFEIKHYGKGWVSMASAGKDGNGSQFFIVTRKLHLFDGQYVVFGKILRGINVVERIQDLETNSGSKPSKTCKIIDSGILETVKPFVVEREDALEGDQTHYSHTEL